MSYLRPSIGSVALSALFCLLALAQVACRSAPEAPRPPEVELLREKLAEAESDPSRLSALRPDLESAMGALLPTAEEVCAGCVWRVSWAEAGGVGYFDLALIGPAAAQLYRFHVFVRDGIDAAQVGLADTELSGCPAVLGERQAAVWAGRVEVRVFPASADARGGDALADLLARLPLEALEQL